MRLKTEHWVSAYMRQRQAAGVFAVLARRGDADGGAIYVRVVNATGLALLFGPAPPSLDGPVSDERAFIPMAGCDAGAQPEAHIDEYLRKEGNFDPDLWIIDIESAQLQHGLEEWLLKEETFTIAWPPKISDF